MCKKELIEKGKAACQKAKQRTCEISAKIVREVKILPEKMPELKQKSQKLYRDSVNYAKTLPEKMPIIKRKAQECWNKSVEFAKTLPEKSQYVIAEAKKNPKQAVVASIIFLFALMLIALSCCDGQKTETTEVALPQTEQELQQAERIKKEPIKIEPQNAVLTFHATAEKNFMYEIYYTVEREVWYDEEHKVTYQGKSGEHKYSIVLPVKYVHHIRIDFGSHPGEVTISDIYMTGSQKADLNSFARCEFSQIDEYKENKDGSLTIISNRDDPYIAYRQSLMEN